MFTAKEMFNGLGVHNLDCRFNGSNFKIEDRSDWLFNSSLAGIDQIDRLLIIGCDPKREATVLNARIRKRWITGELDIISICAPDDLTYKVENLGNDIAILNNADIINTIEDFFQNSKFPMIILGDSILSTEEGENIHAATKKIADSCNVIKKDWNGFNFLLQ